MFIWWMIYGFILKPGYGQELGDANNELVEATTVDVKAMGELTFASKVHLNCVFNVVPNTVVWKFKETLVAIKLANTTSYAPGFTGLSTDRSSSLVIEKLIGGYNGVYECIIEKNEIATSGNISIQLLPESVTIPLHQDQKISCDSKQNLSNYQVVWMKDDIIVTDQINNIKQVGQCLEISSMSTYQVGTYSCYVDRVLHKTIVLSSTEILLIDPKKKSEDTNNDNTNDVKNIPDEAAYQIAVLLALVTLVPLIIAKITSQRRSERTCLTDKKNIVVQHDSKRNDIVFDEEDVIARLKPNLNPSAEVLSRVKEKIDKMETNSEKPVNQNSSLNIELSNRASNAPVQVVQTADSHIPRPIAVYGNTS